MENITLPRSFEDTTPAEMMKSFQNRRSSPSRSPILEDDVHARGYNSITSASAPNTNRPELQGETRQQDEDHAEARDRADHRRGGVGGGFGKRFQKWERAT